MRAEQKSDSNQESDVFISYRRKDGATAARLLLDALKRRGLSVFFDRESIDGENFDDAIRHNLALARNVVVVVSSEMFSRAKNASGEYDDAEVAKDWVYMELRAAMDMQKPIIPVFVNGVSGFPVELPPLITDIARVDALKLDHEHFDPELEKLIGRLVTPRHALLRAYVDVCGDDPSEDDDPHRNSSSVWVDLLRVCKSLDPNANERIENNLLQTINSLWVRKSSQVGTEVADREVLNVLLEREPIDSLKRLCWRLEIDWRGGVDRIRERLFNYLQGHGHALIDAPFKTVEWGFYENDDDRVIDVRDAFSKIYRSVEDRNWIKDVIESNTGIEFYSKRSSFDIFLVAFDQIDVREFFDAMTGALSEDVVKDLSSRILPDNPKGRKNELIDRIVDYVNYRGEYAD